MSAVRCRSTPALLVDLDGTRTDNCDGVARSILYALRCPGAPAPASDGPRTCVGPPLGAAFARLLATDDAARSCAPVANDLPAVLNAA